VERKEIRVKGRNARKGDSAERKKCGKGEFSNKDRECRKKEVNVGKKKCGKGDNVEREEIKEKGGNARK
jgi:hypothetical protein